MILQVKSYENEYLKTILVVKRMLMYSKILLKKYNFCTCLIYKVTFKNIIMYQNHTVFQEKGNNTAYNCDICGKSFAVPARLTRHYRTHTGEKPFQCEYCKKSFSVKENLSVHRRIHTNERPYKCEICEKAFEHSGKLHRHMRIHTGERPHKCLSCNKTFIQSGQLVIHMRTHTGEKPYVCKSCGKGFTCSKQLKVHSRTHTGEKPYKCDICNKSFGYNHVLKLHQAAHYGEKFYKCILCQDTFNSKKIMENHLKIHSESTINFYSKSMIPDGFQIDDNNRSLLIRNKIETKLTRCNKLKFCHKKTVHESTNSIYNDLCTQIRSKDNEIASIPASQNYVNTNFRSFFPNQSNLLKKTISCVENIPTDNKTLNDPICHDTNILNKPYFGKMADDINLKESLLSVHFNGESVHYNDNNYSKQNQDQQGFNNLQDIHTSSRLPSIHNDLKKNTFYLCKRDLTITNKKETLSLPPRKRSKMILKSLEMEKSELLNKRYSSVIKFATRNSSI